MYSDCEAYGLKKQELTRSEYIQLRRIAICSGFTFSFYKSILRGNLYRDLSYYQNKFSACIMLTI